MDVDAPAMARVNLTIGTRLKWDLNPQEGHWKRTRPRTQREAVDREHRSDSTRPQLQRTCRRSVSAACCARHPITLGY
jgi:hypothetical protein